LLAAVNPAEVDAVVAALKANGVSQAAVIGIIENGAVRIKVARSPGH
jgi:hydrogenase maturation factor